LNIDEHTFIDFSKNLTFESQIDEKLRNSKANFIFATHSLHDAAQLAEKLREQGIIVRYFNKPRINQFLRITIGTDEQNQRLVDTLKMLIS
jgi:histidinol-phosphate aminotransferase